MRAPLIPKPARVPGRKWCASPVKPPLVNSRPCGYFTHMGWCNRIAGKPCRWQVKARDKGKTKGEV